MKQVSTKPEMPGADELKAITRASRGTLISAWIFSCLVNILMLTGPLFMLQIYDRVLTSGSVPTLIALISIVIFLYAYYGFLEYLRARLMVRVGRRVEETLRGRVYDVVTTHALRRTTGVGGQPVSDLATIRQYLSGQGPFAFFDMPWVPIYLLIIFAMHWVLGVASALAPDAVGVSDATDAVGVSDATGAVGVSGVRAATALAAGAALGSASFEVRK